MTAQPTVTNFNIDATVSQEDVLVLVAKHNDTHWEAAACNIPCCYAIAETLDDVLVAITNRIDTHTQDVPLLLDHNLIDLDGEKDDEVTYHVVKATVRREVDKEMKRITNPYPRAAVGALIFNEKKEVLTCIRNNGPENYRGKIHAFGGKIDLGETMYEAICREVLEETGINVLSAAKMDFLGVIEEVEHEASVVVGGVNQIYHWVSGVWAFYMEDSFFENIEPHKHIDMQWRKIEDINRLDIAPSFYHTLVVGGFINPNEDWLHTKD